MTEKDTMDFRLDHHSTMEDSTECGVGGQSRKKSITVRDSTPLLADRPQPKLSDRITRKRLQNRLSQQCVREKRLAHAKQLESHREMPKLADTSQLSEELWEAWKEERLALTEENRRLKDSLLEMRKKWLSLSSMAAITADDDIFDDIIPPRLSTKKTNAPRSQQAMNPASTATRKQERQIAQTSPFLPYSPGANLVPMHTNMDKGFNPEPVTEEGIHFSQTLHDDITAFQPPSQRSNSDIVEALLPTVDASQGAEDDPTFCGTIATVSNTAISHFEPATAMAWCDLSLTHDSYPAILPPMIPLGCEDVQTTSLRDNLILTNAWKVEEPCLWYLMQAIGLQCNTYPPGTLQNSRHAYDAVRAAIAALDSDGGIVCDVAKVGVDIILMYSGSKYFVYGLGANEAMEKVLRWRLSPSEHNYRAIPEPFRPTSLQRRTTDYSIAIDSIPWSTIRDQLIMKAGWYDHERTVKDLLLNSVIEIPTLGVAVNIHEIFFSQILPPAIACTNFGSVAENLVGLVKKEFDSNFESNSRGRSRIDLASTSVWPLITRKVREIQGDRNSHLSMPPLADNVILARKQPSASKWGLDNVNNWKLSKEFIAAYPCLDCHSVATSLPTLSLSLMPQLWSQVVPSAHNFLVQ